MSLEKKNKTVFFIGKQKFEVEETSLTVAEILKLVDADPEKKTLVLKDGNDHKELSDLSQVIELKDGMHFALFDKTPTPVS